MATTITRPSTATHTESTVVTPEPGKRGSTGRVLVAGAVAATALLVALVLSGPGTDDHSFDIAESARMTALAPAAVDSFDVNEAARMASLAPVSADSSFDRNEAARLAGLAPGTADGSFETNEVSRLQRLAPLTDTSFQQNEDRRFADLAGAGS